MTGIALQVAISRTPATDTRYDQHPILHASDLGDHAARIIGAMGKPITYASAHVDTSATLRTWSADVAPATSQT